MSGDNFNFDYDNPGRFCTYYQQIQAVHVLHPQSICAIGIQNGLTEWYLKKLGYNLTTVDVSSQVHPDIKASIHKLPFKEKSFDVVYAFQVLEHISFDSFKTALLEMKRISRKNVIISLPDFKQTMRVYLPFIQNRIIRLPIRKKRDSLIHSEHLWEIDHSQKTKIKNILSIISEVGFNINNHYPVSEAAYIHFFIMDNKKN
jgi:hypothetical protein